jgi:hypothetical protein
MNAVTIFTIFLGIANFIPFFTWLLMVTVVPYQGFGGSNKPLRISQSFEQLFFGPSDGYNWGIIVGLVNTILCIAIAIYMSKTGYSKTSDYIFAFVLFFMGIVTAVAFYYVQVYILTPGYQSNLKNRVPEFFKVWSLSNFRNYALYLLHPLIMESARVGTLASTVFFEALAIYLAVRKPELLPILTAGKRRR